MFKQQVENPAPAREKKGPTYVEYGIAILLIVGISVVALILFAPETQGILSTVSHSV